ncbi:hypothetical protein PO909_016187 [Leuciscus waleckii]
MVDVSSPSNQIYEDLTPNTTPRSQTSREAESIERQVSPAAKEKSPPRLINRGVKRLREIYGEEFIYPDNEENTESVSSTTGSKKRFEDYSHESPIFSEDEEISDERDADIFFESEDAVLNTINSERETTESSDDDDGGDERVFTPAFNVGELQGLSYTTLRLANRNFQRVLEIASSPLSYHQTEKIVSESQREVIALLHRISDQQTHHTNELRNAVEFFGRCHDQTSDEIRQLSNEVFSLQQELTEATKTYPIGHPKIIFKDFEEIENYFGLIKAEVLPPHGLYHPVLPYRCGGIPKKLDDESLFPPGKLSLLIMDDIMTQAASSPERLSKTGF